MPQMAPIGWLSLFIFFFFHLAGISSILGAVTFITTVINMRSTGLLLTEYLYSYDQ